MSKTAEVFCCACVFITTLPCVVVILAFFGVNLI
jgi:hypothetical protein